MLHSWWNCWLDKILANPLQIHCKCLEVLAFSALKWAVLWLTLLWSFSLVLRSCCKMTRWSLQFPAWSSLGSRPAAGRRAVLVSTTCSRSRFAVTASWASPLPSLKTAFLFPAKTSSVSLLLCAIVLHLFSQFLLSSSVVLLCWQLLAPRTWEVGRSLPGWSSFPGLLCIWDLSPWHSHPCTAVAGLPAETISCETAVWFPHCWVPTAHTNRFSTNTVLVSLGCYKLLSLRWCLNIWNLLCHFLVLQAGEPKIKADLVSGEGSVPERCPALTVTLHGWGEQKRLGIHLGSLL